MNIRFQAILVIGTILSASLFFQNCGSGFGVDPSDSGLSSFSNGQKYIFTNIKNNSSASELQRLVSLATVPSKVGSSDDSFFVSGILSITDPYSKEIKESLTQRYTTRGSDNIFKITEANSNIDDIVCLEGSEVKITLIASGDGVTCGENWQEGDICAVTITGACQLEGMFVSAPIEGFFKFKDVDIALTAYAVVYGVSTEKLCPSGKNLQIKSPDRTNTCIYSWSDANAGEALEGTFYGNPAGKIDGVCLPDGSWNYSIECSNEVTQSCHGGAKNVSSPDKTNSCIFTWASVSAGEEGNAIGTNGGEASGKCLDDGTWSYTYNCPNEKVITCSGIDTVVASPDGSNRCRMFLPLSSANTSAIGTASNGGTASGDCLESGQWDYQYNCPNKDSLTCAGGSKDVKSPDSSNTCRLAWSSVSAGESTVGNGTNGGSVSATCSVNGQWYYNYLCPNLEGARCIGGAKTFSSPDGTNSCQMSWPSASEGESAVGVSTNNGSISGECLSDGTWNFSYICPNKVTKACAGGSTAVKSPDGTNSCTFNWGQATAGSPLSASATGSPKGSASGSCQSNGSWSYSFVCPNKVTKACAGGSTAVKSPDGTNSCTFSWGQATAGSPLSASATGSPKGSASGSCQSDGSWSYSFGCPNKLTASCAGGSGSVPSPDGKKSCSFSWPQRSAGQSFSGTGTNGGKISGTCRSTGEWSYSASCPN